MCVQRCREEQAERQKTEVLRSLRRRRQPGQVSDQELPRRGGSSIFPSTMEL